MIARLAFGLVLLAFGLSSGTAAQSERRAVFAGHGYVGTSLEPVNAVLVSIEDGKIIDVTHGVSLDAAKARFGKSLEVYPDAFLLPGLIDTHVYLTLNPNDRDSAVLTTTNEAATLVAARNAHATVCAGVTTVRDMGAIGKSVVAVRDAVNSDALQGPRIISVLEGLSAVGGHTDVGGFRPDILSRLAPGVTATCSGDIDCRRRVREQARDGADAVRISAGGGILSSLSGGFAQQLTSDEMKAIVNAAHGLGLSVASSQQGGPAVAAAIESGADTLEMVALGTEADAVLMKARGTALASGLSVFQALRNGLRGGRYSPAVAAKAESALNADGRFVQLAHARGVTIIMGSFAGLVPHGKNTDEIEHLVSSGKLSTRDALIAATSGAARALRLSEKTGSIQSGTSADLLLVASDPMRNMSSLSHPVRVYVRGAPVTGCAAHHDGSMP
jgi:imidazolonepropionase-like amidohydrolase